MINPPKKIKKPTSELKESQKTQNMKIIKYMFSFVLFYLYNRNKYGTFIW